MSKKHQRRLKELQRIRAMHTDDQIGVMPAPGVSHTDEVEGIAPIVPSGTQVHSSAAHVLVRKDFAGLFFTILSLVVILFVIYWLSITTNLDDRFIALMQNAL